MAIRFDYDSNDVINGRSEYSPLWRFDTARYTVAFWAEEEDMQPSDSMEFAEDIEFASNGDLAHWFCAFVGVFDMEGDCLGYDCLGGCSYNSFDEFISAHRDRDPMNRNCSIMRAAKGQNVSICHYFPGMVKTALDNATETIIRRKLAMVRERA